MRESSRPPAMALGWIRSGQNRGEAPPTEPELRHRATIALASNLVVALFLFGLLSIPGAISAGMARRAAARDPDRAARLIRWSWAFLITNVLFYLLLLVVVLVIGGYLYLIARSRT